MTDRLSTRSHLLLRAAHIIAFGLLLSGCVADKAPDDVTDASDVSNMDMSTDVDTSCGTLDDTQTCECDNGAFGTQSCLASGQWGVCDCAVDTDCEVSDWTDYGECSVMCGGGMETRTRTVIREASGDGMACPELMESRACNTQSCETCTDGIWNNGEEDIDCGGPCPLGCPGHRIDSVDIAGTGLDTTTIYNSLWVNITFDFTIATPGCSNCRTQLLVVSETGTGPDQYTMLKYGCLYDDIPTDVPVMTESGVAWPEAKNGTEEIRVVQTFESDCDAAIQSLFAPGPRRGPIVAEVTGFEAPGSLQIQHLGTNNCINLIDWTAGASAFNVIACGGSSDQRLDPSPNGTSGDRYVSSASFRCMSVAGGSTANGAQIQQVACDPSDLSQHWKLRALEGGYQLIAQHSSKCVHIGGDASAGSVLEQWDCLPPGDPNLGVQLFTMFPP